MTGKTLSANWLIILFVIIIALQIYMVFSSRKSDSTLIFRDSLIQKKIDSVNLNIDTYFDHMIQTNETQIEEKEKRIIDNKKTYKSLEEKILHTTADSVYLWTKSKLRERANGY